MIIDAHPIDMSSLPVHESLDFEQSMKLFTEMLHDDDMSKILNFEKDSTEGRLTL